MNEIATPSSLLTAALLWLGIIGLLTLMEIFGVSLLGSSTYTYLSLNLLTIVILCCARISNNPRLALTRTRKFAVYVIGVLCLLSLIQLFVYIVLKLFTRTV